MIRDLGTYERQPEPGERLFVRLYARRDGDGRRYDLYYPENSTKHQATVVFAEAASFEQVVDAMSAAGVAPLVVSAITARVWELSEQDPG